nr:MAG TPA: DNA polymerase III, alpha subunit [Caudoviricetes sp.]
MTDSLRRWAEDNYLAIEEKRDDELNIIAIEGVGDFLYLHPDDSGKIIDERFSFAVTADEFDALYDGAVKYILFEFGGKFYYSNIKKDHLRLDKTVVFRPEFRDFKYLGTSTAEELVPFVHLGVHSEYEFLNGSSNCEEWAAKAKFNRMTALGICDRNTLAGTLAFQTACLGKGLKPIIGETVTVACNYDSAADVQETFALKLYVTSPEGWRNLLLVNKAINVDYQGFIPSEELYKLGRGLICVIPPDSELNYFKSDAERCKALLEAYHTAFDQVYYQIDTVEFESEALFRAHLEAIDTYICRCRKMKAYRQTLPIVINDSYYLDREEAPLKSLLNKVAGVVNAESATQYFKNSKETILAYEEWMDVAAPLYEKIIVGMTNSSTLAESIDFKIPTGIRHLPKYEFVKTTVEDAFFEKLEAGVQERLVGKVDNLDQYLAELEKECAIIVPNGLCDYFMILWDIMNWCREQGIMTGSGRGSVCGSLIAYCLYITDVDPLKYDLMFERFLNATRVSGERAKSSDSLPDVDADFPVAFRDTVKEYMSKRYGVNHVCSVGTYTRMKLKTCLKDFGKVMGVPFAVMNKLTKDIDDQIEYTWGDLFNYAATSRELFRFVQDHPELVHMTKYALTQCKTSSIHPSAVIVVPQEDEDGNPIDLFGWMPMKKMGDVLVSEWEGKYVDKSGFLKEDILGLNQLDKFSSIIKLIAKNRREQIDVNTIPFNDEEVYRYFQRGWCEDVFQFGAMGLMNYCREAKPQSLDDLIAMTALFRPGPMDVKAHETFVDIKNGRKKPKFDPGMEDITRDTYSLYTYQEQIMKAMVVGGLTPIESDECRTYIKKKNHTALAQFKEKFVNGYSNLIKSKGVAEKRAVEQASEVWEKMLAFASYGFNKSHAVAYTMMSYWSQWFKVNYPLEFWTTSLQYASKESDIPYRLVEMKKTGAEIEVRPPDINFSGETFTCDPKTNRIFFSLGKVKGVGERALTLLKAMKDEHGEVFSFEDFITSAPKGVNRTVVLRLIMAGAFDLVEDIRNPRQRLDIVKQYLERRGEPLSDEFTSPDAHTNAWWVFKQRELTGYGEVDYERMMNEYGLGKRMVRLYVTAAEFERKHEGDEVCIVGRVNNVFERQTKGGDSYGVLQVEVNDLIIQITLWPDFWLHQPENEATLLNRIVAVSGRVNYFAGKKTVQSSQSTRLEILQ